MKGLARSYVWWPNIDADLEAQVKQCNQCQVNQPSPPAVPMHSWEWPEHPWERIHVDYVGPLLGKMFLIVVDALLNGWKLRLLIVLLLRQQLNI